MSEIAKSGANGLRKVTASMVCRCPKSSDNTVVARCSLAAAKIWASQRGRPCILTASTRHLQQFFGKRDNIGKSNQPSDLGSRLIRGQWDRQLPSDRPKELGEDLNAEQRSAGKEDVLQQSFRHRTFRCLAAIPRIHQDVRVKKRLCHGTHRVPRASTCGQLAGNQGEAAATKAHEKMPATRAKLAPVALE